MADERSAVRVVENFVISVLVWLACLMNLSAVVIITRLEKAVPFTWILACSVLAFVVTFALMERANSRDIG